MHLTWHSMVKNGNPVDTRGANWRGEGIISDNLLLVDHTTSLAVSRSLLGSSTERLPMGNEVEGCQVAAQTCAR